MKYSYEFAFKGTWHALLKLPTQTAQEALLPSQMPGSHPKRLVAAQVVPLAKSKESKALKDGSRTMDVHNMPNSQVSENLSGMEPVQLSNAVQACIQIARGQEPSGAPLRKLLMEVFGHDDFRGPQLKIIETVLEGTSALAILPTGELLSLHGSLQSWPLAREPLQIPLVPNEHLPRCNFHLIEEHFCPLFLCS